MNDTQMNRLYNDLAWLWPYWGDLEEYREESEQVAQYVRKYSLLDDTRTLLDLCCGGGKNDFHFKQEFAVTGVDLSQPMLDLALKLNPECTYLQGDIRTLELQQYFHAVYINDGLVYMSSQDDLRRAFRTAYEHLLPGGVMITCAEYLKETFSQNESAVTTAQRDDLYLTFIENSFDPDPDDDTFEMTFVYLIRVQGNLIIEHDHHRGGLFTLDFWMQALLDTGFKVTRATLTDQLQEFPLLICQKPKQ